MIDTKALRQKVLDLAIRGKLVPQDPNDEPASVLLDRIRAQKQQMVKDGKLKAKDIKNDTVIFVGEDNLHYEKFADGSVKCIEDEIPFDLPEGWEWERLSNIASFSGGKTPSTSVDLFWGKDVLWVTSKDMKTKYIDSSLMRLSNLGAEQLQIYPSGTLLLVVRSGILRHTLPISILKTPATVNQDLKAISIYCDNLEEYIYICLKSFENTILHTYTKAGATVENINFDAFQKILLPFAPKNQMPQIISSVQCTDELITTIDDETVALKESISQAKSKILDLAIRGKLVPQDPNDEPASILLERIRDKKEELIEAGKIKRDKKESVIFKGEDNSYYEKIGNTITCIDDEIPFDLPLNWQFVRLKEVCELISGRDLQPSNYNSENIGIPYITGASNFLDDGIQIERWTNEPQVVSEKGDLLLTCKGTVGKMSFNTFGNAHIARQIMAIRNRTQISEKYLKLCLDFYIEKIKKSAKGLIPGISRDDMLNIILPIPSTQCQATIIDAMDKTLCVLNTVEASLL